MKRKDVLELVQEESSQVDLAASNEGPLGEQIVGMEEVGVTVSIKTPTVQHEKEVRPMQQPQRQSGPCNSLSKVRAPLSQGDVATVLKTSSSSAGATPNKGSVHPLFPKVPSQRSVGSSTSELTMGTSDPFNSGLGDAPSLRLDTTDTTLGSASMFSALELGETSVISGREALGDNLSDKGISQAERMHPPCARN